MSALHAAPSPAHDEASSPEDGGSRRHLSGPGLALMVGGVLVFALALVFFTCVCPLVPSDADDWLNLGLARSGLPEWGGFNPSKVVPELLLPLTGYIAGFLVMPLTGSFIRALALTAALLVAGVITAYVCLFGRILQMRAQTSPLATVCLMLGFYLAHLVILSHTAGRGAVPFLFGTLDFTGYFHYIIPGLLGACVAMWIELRGPRLGGRDLPLLVLALYLAMFTHILENVVLAAYAGASLLVALPTLQQKGKDLRKRLGAYVRENAVYLLVVVLWVTTLLFEMSGGRASGTMSGEGGGLHVGAVLADLLVTLSYLNRKLMLVFLLGIGAAVVLASRARERWQTGVLRLVLQVGLTLGFTIVLSSVMDPYTQTILPSHYYASRTDTLVIAAFPCLVCAFVALGRCAMHWRPVEALVPVFVFVLFAAALSHVGNYSEPTKGSTTGANALRMDEYLVAQVVAADEAGAASVEVHVPTFSNSFAYNWPMAPFGAVGMGRALHVFGVTANQLDVSFVPDEAVNEMFNIHAPAV